MVALVSLIAGCSSLSKPKQLIATNPNSLTGYWYAEGRLAVTSPTANLNGSFNWLQEDVNFSLEVVGPFGQGHTKISGQPFYIELINNQHQLAAASPELLFAELDWQLPVSNLVYWLQGKPAPGLIESLAPNKFYQQGWLVEIRKFMQVNNQPLPSLLLITNNDYQLRLAIKKWQLSLE